MTELLFLIVGAASGYAFCLYRASRPAPPAQPQPSHSIRPPEEVARDVAEIRQVDEELADQITAAPAVAPEAIPAVIDEHARNLQSAEQVIGRVPHADLQHVLRVLWGWKPRSREGNEKGYVNSMLAYMRRNGVPSNEVERERRIQWAGGKRWAQPDVVVRGKVLVEIKSDLTTSSASDRSLGQMLRYLLAFKQIGPAVLIICGERDPLMTMIVRQYVEVWRSELRLPVTVWFAREESASQVDDRVVSLGGGAAE
jgi:hypothetical protein